MVKVNSIEKLVESDASIDRVTLSHPVNRTRTVNQSIAILLRSYTRAINKQENRSGALFRESTKAECLNCPKLVAPTFINESGITQIKIQNPKKEYPQVCFNYIHQNPVKAGLVKTETDWEFSSARDYEGIRNGKLINKEFLLELGLKFELNKS